MTTQHTPGPWSVEIIKNGGDWTYVIRGNNALTLESGKVLRPGTWVAEVNASLPGSIIQANARLIAAAPETAAERDRLREALDAIHEAAGTCGSMEGELIDVMDRIEAIARDALADTTPLAPDPLREAAPELLAALKDAEDSLLWAKATLDDAGRRSVAEAMDASVTEIRAAIAKAEGRP